MRTTCDTALEICAVSSVDHMLDQQLTRPEELEEEEQISEDKATFLDTLKN